MASVLHGSARTTPRVRTELREAQASRRSHDRASGSPPFHLVSAFATTNRLVLAQEAIPVKANELAATPVLLDRLRVDGGLEGATVSIDAIACNAGVAHAVRGAGADDLRAVKANQPSVRREIGALFADPETEQRRFDDLGRGHGRIERRRVSVPLSGVTSGIRGLRRSVRPAIHPPPARQASGDVGV